MSSSSSLATVRRMQPMRTPAARSGSVSSFSSSASETSSKQHTIESEPIQSTSTGKRSKITEMVEEDLQPMIGSPKHVSFMQTVDLCEASIATHSYGNIDPTRDGVFARVRSVVLRFGVAASIGTAVGAGGVVIGRQFIQKNISEITLITSTT